MQIWKVQRIQRVQELLGDTFDASLEVGWPREGSLPTIHWTAAPEIELQLHLISSHLDRKVQTTGRKQRNVRLTCQLQTIGRCVPRKKSCVFLSLESFESTGDAQTFGRFSIIAAKMLHCKVGDVDCVMAKISLGSRPERGLGLWWLAAWGIHRQPPEEI